MVSAANSQIYIGRVQGKQKADEAHAVRKTNPSKVPKYADGGSRSSKVVLYE